MALQLQLFQARVRTIPNDSHIALAVLKAIKNITATKNQKNYAPVKAQDGMDGSNNFPNTDVSQIFLTPSKAKNPISFKESTLYPIPQSRWRL
jgi:hypothetical protein